MILPPRFRSIMRRATAYSANKEKLVRTAGFEPATSGISGRRLCRLGYVRGTSAFAEASADSLRRWRRLVRAGGFEPPLSSL